MIQKYCWAAIMRGEYMICDERCMAHDNRTCMLLKDKGINYVKPAGLL